MTKPATPMPFVAVKPTPERLVKELGLMHNQHETWHATLAHLHRFESDRARLIEVLSEFINACNPMPGKGVCIMDGDYPLPKARSLLHELEEPQ